MRSLSLALSLVCALSAFAVDLSNDITVENVVRLMNEARGARGIAPLRADASLTKAAEDRMRDMENGGWWDHISPDGVSPFVWLAARNYYYSTAAENLAVGFETAPLLVEAWMESAGHRENIMGEQFDDCGVAIIEGATTGPMKGKSVVVLFARRSPTRP